MKVRHLGWVLRDWAMWTESWFLKATRSRVRLLRAEDPAQNLPPFAILLAPLRLSVLARKPQKDTGLQVSCSLCYPSVPHVPQGLNNYLYTSELVFMEETLANTNQNRKTHP